MATITSINPANGQTLARFETLDPAAIDAALDRAVAAQRAWGMSPVDARQAMLRRLAGTQGVLMGSHFAPPTAGRVVADGAGYRLVSDKS